MDGLRALWELFGRGEFRDERGKARDKGARAVFLEGAKVGEEVTIVSDDGRDDVGFWWVQWPAEDRGAVRLRLLR